MKYAIPLMMLMIVGCDHELPPQEFNVHDWSGRSAVMDESDSLVFGRSYLSVYSQVYSFTQKQKYALTGTISLRNVSDRDTIYFLKTDYFNTAGVKIRSYVDQPIYVSPMETIEIVIAQNDVEGGTGSNFLIEWKTPRNCPEPLFEGVMVSMLGTQGISFTTRGVRIE